MIFETLQNIVIGVMFHTNYLSLSLSETWPLLYCTIILQGEYNFSLSLYFIYKALLYVNVYSLFSSKRPITFRSVDIEKFGIGG